MPRSGEGVVAGARGLLPELGGYYTKRSIIEQKQVREISVKKKVNRGGVETQRRHREAFARTLYGSDALPVWIHGVVLVLFVVVPLGNDSALVDRRWHAQLT